MNLAVQIDDIDLPKRPVVQEILNGAEERYLQNEQAEINASALLGLCGSLSAGGKADVSQSLLFAQLAADALFDKAQAPDRWVAKMIETMEILGWRLYQYTSFGRGVVPRVVSWRDRAIGAFEKGYGGPARLVRRTVSTASGFAASSSSARLWQGHSHVGKTGAVLVGLGDADDASGDPVLSLMFGSYTVDVPAKGILAWDATGVWSDEFLVMTLSTDIYDSVRAQVTDRLGSRVNTDIEKIALC